MGRVEKAFRWSVPLRSQGFVLNADNAEAVLTSELYHAKGSAENGIASMQSNCREDERDEKKLASNGKHDFKRKTANH